MKELKWRVGENAETLALAIDLPFCTIDPGACGVGLVFAPLTSWKTLDQRPRVVVSLRGRDVGAVQFAERAAAIGASLVIIEEPFIGRANVQSALMASRTVGYLQGAFVSKNAGANVLMVPAQSWQARALPRHLGTREVRKSEAVSIIARMMEDDTRWLSASAALRGAIADATLIARWWAMVRRPELRA